MPRGGALTLSDIAGERLTIACAPCGRRGSYAIARLWRDHGDARLTDLRSLFATDCPDRARQDRACHANFEGLIERRR